MKKNTKSCAVEFTNALTEIDYLRKKLKSPMKTHDLEVVRTVVNIGSFVFQGLILLHLLGVV